MAWKHHPGRFADGALENPVLRLGDDVPRSVVAPRLRAVAGAGKSRTLHVATTVYAIGGHTRVLAKWIARDAKSASAVVLTNQSSPCPDFLDAAVTSSGGEIYRLPATESLLRRAALVRAMSRLFDRVILHAHPQDPMPIAAFSVTGGPPIAMFNHAHFGFSLGPTVSDVTINTMEYFRGVTKKYRFPRSTALLPGTSGMAAFDTEAIDKLAAKRAIGISESAPVLLSIASEEYFAPLEGYDFFRTASRLLSRIPTAHLLVVGVPQESTLVPDSLRGHERFRCLGNVVDPSMFYRAADLCLESFPMPSLGALVESVIYGEAWPVPVYGPGESILRVSQPPILTHPYRPVDEDEYLAHIEDLLRRLPEKRAEARDIRVRLAEFDRECGQRFHEINQLIDGLTHAPAEIPVAPMSDSADCRVLAELTAASLVEAPNHLPYARAVPMQIAATVKGMVDPRDAAYQIVNRPWSAIRRRLPLRR